MHVHTHMHRSQKASILQMRGKINSNSLILTTYLHFGSIVDLVILDVFSETGIRQYYGFGNELFDFCCFKPPADVVILLDEKK